MAEQSTLKSQIVRIVESFGLELLGIVSIDSPLRINELEEWLQDGRHGFLKYLENHIEIRRKPEKLLPGAKSALILGLNYDAGDRMSSEFRKNPKPRIAQYARAIDYHKTFWQLENKLATQLRKLLVQEFNHRMVTDSAPILERSMAESTSQGFIGKNTCWIHPEKGSFFLLAEFLLDIDLPKDHKAAVDPQKRTESGGCGSCKKCQVNCPTNALSEDYKIDARRCLSSYTIENRDEIPREFWPHLKYYWFGCDICQLVCPYNRKSEAKNFGKDKQYLQSLDLYDVATMDEHFYLKHFAGTPMTRPKKDGLRRNALIAMYESKHPRLAAAVALLQSDREIPEMIKRTINEINYSLVRNRIRP